MAPPPLSVTAEESKAKRVQRQQARFRDRGGVFVPATTNPLVDILLARTVSGESPSKRLNKNTQSRATKANGHVKDHPSTTHPNTQSTPNDEIRASGDTAKDPVAGTSRAARDESAANLRVQKKKRKTKTVSKTTEAQDDDDRAANIPKPRSRPSKSKTKPVHTAEPDVKPKRGGKTNAHARSVATTSKSKPRAKTKAAVDEDAILSDDDTTLVETPRKPSSKKRKVIALEVESEDEEEVYERVDDAATRQKKPKLAKPSKRVDGTKGKSSKESSSGVDGDTRRAAKKRPPIIDDSEREDGEDPRPSRPVLKNAKLEKPLSTEKKVQLVIPVAQESEEPPQPSRKKKRVAEETDDDRAKKARIDASKGSTSGHLKENASRSKTSKSKPPSRSKTTQGNAKGPPPSVLERIKASAVHYKLKKEETEDSEPDPLDCLS